MIDIAVIGLGHNGRAFCRAYADHPVARLVAVCDRDDERLRAAAYEYDVKGYRDYSVLDNPDVHAVSIHTGDHQHAEPFLRALEAGKHVFVEKPLANSLDDVRRMLAAAQASDRVIMVGHVLRFNPVFRAVKQWVDSGALGELCYLEADYIHDLRCQRDMEQWKLAEEIPIVGGGCHPLDLLRWYAGDVTEVFAYSNRIAYPEMTHPATCASVYRFASGAVGRVTALYGCVNPMPELYNLGVFGTKGTVTRNRLSLDGLHEWMEIPLPPPGHPFEPEVAHFLDCISSGKRPLTDALEGAKTAAAVLCAAESARTGKPVQVPPLGT
ncbi:MAG: Gfo/Idh/MocA family oxidoreductase [Armatimonadota bacterium]|nr:MAG: Gfo/Idh/MocA family oxidoreductase [Armatimonadota bacterium]